MRIFKDYDNSEWTQCWYTQSRSLHNHADKENSNTPILQISRKTTNLKSFLDATEDSDDDFPNLLLGPLLDEPLIETAHETHLEKNK